MPPKNAKQIIKVLRGHGFILSRQKGSHMIWKNPESGIIVPVPLHTKSRTLPIGTYLAIVKQSEISKEEFER